MNTFTLTAAEQRYIDELDEQIVNAQIESPVLLSAWTRYQRARSSVIARQAQSRVLDIDLPMFLRRQAG